MTAVHQPATENFDDLAKIAKLRFEQAAGDVYSDAIAQTHDLGEQYSNEGIQSGGKYMRKAAELVLNRFRSLEQVFGEAYVNSFAMTAEGVTQERASWLKSQTQPFVHEQVRRAHTVMESVCSRFGTPGQCNMYVMQLQGEGDLLQRRLYDAITLAELNTKTRRARSDSAESVRERQKDDLLPVFRRKDFDGDLLLLVSSATVEDPVSLVMIDLDHFKKVNDTHGHAVGDEVLIACANVVAARCKGKGTVYRFGGEEIAMLLPNYTTAEAVLLAELIREHIAQQKMGSPGLTITASFGVATTPMHAADSKELLQRADGALYEAKKLGRNLVRVAGEKFEATSPHAPSRRMPQAGGFKDPQVIRELYFSGQVVRCPEDGAVLRIRESQHLAQRTPSLLVSCPFCGLSETIDGPD